MLALGVRVVREALVAQGVLVEAMLLLLLMIAVELMLWLQLGSI